MISSENFRTVVLSLERFIAVGMMAIKSRCIKRGLTAMTKICVNNLSPRFAETFQCRTKS